jgi:formylglycine-generating enzyme required for sulfatase activity
MKKLLVFAALVSLVIGFVFPKQTGGINHTLVTFKGQRVIQFEKKKEKENPFGKEINNKAKRVYKNEKGFWEVDYGDGIVMVYIPPGEFSMGSNEYSDERPPHTVFLDGYWIGKYEVTFAQYDKYCEESGNKKPGDRGWGRGNRPVITVSWDEASAYCDWLSNKTGLEFKLPTEAQWEKSARGSGGRKYPWGDDFPRGDSANFADKQSSISWADENIDDGYTYTAPVGSYPRGASPYGVHDMAGNVWEWCSDWYDSDYYKKSPHKNPRGPETGSIHVVRGGSWGSDAGELRSADRRGGRSFDRDVDLGFRLCQENK